MNVPHAKLQELIAALRAQGVRVYQGTFEDAPIMLELGPPVALDVAEAKAETQTDLCNCKHATWEHTAGLCLRGCDPQACAGPQTQ